MAFEIYKRTRATSEAETVSINSAGTITISPACTDKYLKGVRYVELYFDAVSKKVGIKPVTKETDYSYQLFRPAKSRRASVSGRGFLSSYKINQTEKGRFKPQTFDALFENNMI